MKGSSDSTSPQTITPRSRLIRKAILVGAALIVPVAAILLLKPLPRHSAGGQESAALPIVTAPELETPPAGKVAPAREDFAPPPPVPHPALPIAAIQTNANPAPPQQRDARQLIAELAGLSDLPGPISPEQAKQFKQVLEELVRQGAASVPAIQEFLGKNLEYNYNEVSGGDQLSYSSLRHSLIDALKQIGGPEAQSALLQVIQTSALPAELLESARNLEQEAPGQYRDQILKAARESLEMSAAGQFGTNVELGPAYRMLDSYGTANTVDDLAKNNPASFYNALALANLPDAQGLPSLMQMAQTPSPDASGQTIATEMIAQLAAQSGAAAEALMQMAQNGQIRNSVWDKLAPILAGDQYQLNASTGQSPATGNAGASVSGNQNYVVINGANTPDQINRRIALIDRFLGVVDGDSAAAAALRHQRDVLSGKLGS